MDDDKTALLQQRIKELMQKMEEKDRLLQFQAVEIRKTTQLQAQLQA